MSPLVDLASVSLEPMLFGMKWMDPAWLLEQFGAELFWISIIIIFVECGLFFPFLPGDSLLFAMGIFLAHPDTGIDIFPGPVWLEVVIGMALFVAAGFGGNIAGYEIGRKIGPPLYERDGRILKRKYFDQTTAFFDKHGNKALVIGRFVPFVRTYITVVAGVTHMDRSRFFKWSMIGALLWVLSITLLGVALGTAFPALGENIDYAIIAIIAFSVIPMVWEWFRHKRTNAPGAEIGPQDGGPDRDILGEVVGRHEKKHERATD